MLIRKVAATNLPYLKGEEKYGEGGEDVVIFQEVSVISWLMTWLANVNFSDHLMNTCEV